MINLFRYISFRHLFLRPGRTVLTTLGVSLGVALFIGIRIINQSTLDSFEENIHALTGKAQLSVSAGEAGFSEDRMQIIKNVPGVYDSIPVVEARGYLVKEESLSNPNSSGRTETLFILGVDLLKEQSVRSYQTVDDEMIEDPLVFLNQPDSVILTQEFAKEHDLEIDDEFSLATVFGKKVFTVRGLLKAEGPAKAYGGAIAIMDIDGARFSFGKEGKVDRVDLVLESNAKVETVAFAVEKALGPGYQATRPQGQAEALNRMVASYQMMMTFFSSLALLVGIILIANSVSISVAERKKEIGTLRALGSGRFRIWILFLSEAVIMGLTGAFAGAWMGKGLAYFMVEKVSETLTTQYLTRVDISRLNFGLEEVSLSLAIGVGASLVASFWPAFQATRIEPLEAMKNRTLSFDQSRGRFFSYTPFAGFIMIILVTVFSALGLVQQYPVIENFNQFLSVIGAALVGPAIFRFLMKVIRPVAVGLGGTITRLAQDNLVRNPKRTASNIMGLMVGLVLVILIASVNSSFRTTIDSWFERVLKSDLIVSSNGKILSYQTQPVREEIGREIEQIPGVVMGPEMGAYGIRFLHLDYQGQRLAVKAYDEPDPAQDYPIFDMLDRTSREGGRALYHSGHPAVLVSDNFRLHFHKKTGDQLTLNTPQGPVEFEIVGIVSDFASDVGVLYMDRNVYKKIWDDPLVNAFGVNVKPGFSVADVRKEIDQTLGQKRNIMVTSNAELRKQMNEVVDQSFANTRAIEFAALMVGLLGLLNTLLISVMERTRELGMLRAIGMTRAQVSWMILQEALFQGGIGAVVAAGIGCWFAYLWVSTSLAHVLGWIVQFYFPWASIGTVLLAGIAVALVAGFLPSQRAANLQISEALDYE